MAEGFLPPLIVELKASISDFQAKMGEAKAELASLQEESAGSMEQMAAVGKGAMLATAAVIGVVGAAALHLADQFEQAHARLETAFKNAGANAEQFSKQLGTQEDAFAKLGISQTKYEDALGTLVGLTHDTAGSFKEMGLAADLAAFKHIGLSQAATIVAKVMDGNVGFLKRFGIEIQTTGNKAVDAKAGIDALTGAVGGTAQAQADTFAGHMKALWTEIDNAATKLGLALVPALDKAAGAFSAVAGFLSHHIELLAGLAGLIAGPLVTALLVYVGVQAKAFAETAWAGIGKLTELITGGLIPAFGALTVAEEEEGTALTFATAGISALLAVGGGLLAHFMGHKSAASSAAEATKSVTDAMNQAKLASADLSGALDGENGVLDENAKRLKTADDLYKQLAGDTAAQGNEITKLINDQRQLTDATNALHAAKTTEDEVTKWQTQHTKDLEQAQKQLDSATKTVTSDLKAQQDAQKALDDLMQPQSADAIAAAGVAQDRANTTLARAKIDVTDKQKAYNTAVRDFGANSEEAQSALLDLNDAEDNVTQAQIDLDTSTQNLGDAQRQTKGTTQQIADANDTLKSATQKLKDDTLAAKDAQNQYNTVLGQSPAAAVAGQQQNLADKTLAVSTAAATLKGDWQGLMDTITAHPELKEQLVGQLRDMESYVKGIGGDVKPFEDFLTQLNKPLDPNSALKTLETFKVSPELNALVSNPALIGGAGLLGTGSIGLVGVPAPSGPQLGPAVPSGPLPGAPVPQQQPIGYVFQLGAFGAPHAAGGPVDLGVAYPVGENGPEMFVPGTSGTIIPNGGFGSTVHVGQVTFVVQGADDPITFARRAREELLRLSRGTSNVGLS